MPVQNPDASDIFQSTPSVRRATSPELDPINDEIFQSTPSVRRATLADTADPYLNDISIHALREEGDRWRTSLRLSNPYFNPRPP